MARTVVRPEATQALRLLGVRRNCVICGRRMRYAYNNTRKITTLGPVVHLTLEVRRCENEACEGYRRPYRPESEGRWALPEHEFGLDVVAEVGRLRYREHRSIPEMHVTLRSRKVMISERSVTNLLDRYDELLAVGLTDDERLKNCLHEQGRVILAIDGMQPDVGHEVLWVLRDCLSGEILMARSMLSASTQDLAALIAEVRNGLPVPIEGVISDGQTSIRKAVAEALPDVAHGLCHFHYLREAARPIYEADRHAKVQLKKRVRGVRPIERSAEGRQDPAAAVIRGYCAAVRSALTDDGRPPMEASGLKLQDRLSAIAESLDRVEKGGA